MMCQAKLPSFTPGKFIVNPLKIPEIVVPDLEGFTVSSEIFQCSVVLCLEL